MAMFALAAAICLVPSFPDRAKFLSALKALPDRAPIDRVVKALGRPDRVEPTGDYTENGKRISTEMWFYGTDTPSGAATLAQFQVADGQIAYHPVSTDPPPVTVINEVELRRGMHLVLDHLPEHTGDFFSVQANEQAAKNMPLAKWVARTANLLLPLGEPKCKAIIGECGRVSESGDQLSPILYFLTYALFDPPTPPGYFDDYGPVWNAPLDESSHVTHPRWPVEFIKNEPVIRGQPLGTFGGFAPSFIWSFGQLKSRIHLRRSPLTEPTGESKKSGDD